MPIKKPRFNWFRQRPHKAIAWFQGHEKTASWLGAVFTGLIFLVTAIYATVAYFQMRAMNATVQQTQILIGQQKESLTYAKTQAEAAKTSADAAKISADAAKIQADSMREQSGTLKDSLAETRKAANAAVTQASASMSQASTAKRSTDIADETLRTERRPSLGVSGVSMVELAVGKPAHIMVAYQNFGHSASRNTGFTTTTWRDIKVCADPPKESPILGIDIHSHSTVPVNVTKFSHGYTSDVMPQEWIDLIQHDPPLAWVYVYSRADYEDGKGGKYFTEFYGRWEIKTSTFAECPTHNDAN